MSSEQVRQLLDEGSWFTYDNFATHSARGYIESPLPAWVAWTARVEGLVMRICGENSAPVRTVSEGRSVRLIGNGPEKFERARSLFMGALQVAADSARAEVTRAPDTTPTSLMRIFDRFHVVTRQLRDRHDGRATLDVADEYDVQDLLHALLRLYFDDVRPEEWTPSYAGGSSRTDFLLKKERVFVEVKKTRASLSKRDLGDQLIVDIARYQAHPDCGALYCFVYDPEARIGNPAELESDLSRETPIPVRVYVRPTT